MHCSREQLQQADISLKQIYEIDTVVVESTRRPVSMTLVQNLIEPVQWQIFTFTLQSSNTAHIEFFSSDACEQWLLVSNRLERRFHVTIKPRIEYVETEDSTPEKTRPRTDIKLTGGWTLVANHPNFSIEYNNFIRE